MAINTFTESSDKIPHLPLSSLNSSKGSIIQNRLVKTNFGTNSSATSSNKSKNRRNGKPSSPYLNSEKVHVLSRVTEKRVVQKKATDFASSFPLAVNIYKANSDEFKSVRKNRRTKKSVLTLPNEQAPTPQTCTVSDMNDSEELSNNDTRRKRPKKRPTGQNRRFRNDFEFYDRDARYCSQFNIHLDCSSTDVIRNFNGDDNKKMGRKKQYIPPKSTVDGNFNGHDVWRILRNINRFQFQPSPPMSEEGSPLPRKKGNMRCNRNDTRFIETCRTEEFAYISSIEVDSKSPTFSHSSSFDRITVIDKKDEFQRICEEFEKKIVKNQNVARNPRTQKNNRNKNKIVGKKTFKICNKGPESKESNQSRSPKILGIEFKNSYENNTTGTMSTYSSSNVNEDSLTFNAHVDVDARNANSVQNNQAQNSANPSKTIISSVNTATSKTALHVTLRGLNKSFKTPEETSNLPITGITKVVLSKGQDVVLSKRSVTPKRKTRLATTLTTAAIVPKLTQTDIRRRLLNMKFPIVILGKDQVSSAVQVTDFNPPQFEGLDKHIWPFMIEWSDDCSKLKMELESITSSKEILSTDSKYEDTMRQKQNFRQFHGDHNFNNTKFDTNVCKQSIKREQKWSNETKSILNKCDRNPVSPTDIIKETQQLKKPKPMRQLKDKVLKLLYKKPRDIDVTERDPIVLQKCDLKHSLNANKRDVSVNKTIKSNTIPDIPQKRNLSASNSKLMNASPVPTKRPWAKAKWASDFIENVIKKIKSGAYYNQDVKHEQKNLQLGSSSLAVAKEVSVQTRSSLDNTNKGCKEAAEAADQLLVKRNELLKALPGFDNTLPEIEVQTLGTNKIEIKNRVTNVIVQFDISIPMESDKLSLHVKNSCSLIPVEKSDSNTKLFKCKATILNAMLPAELCTILPNMMREIAHPDNMKVSHPLPMNKTDSQLSTISELSHFDGFEYFKPISIISLLSPEIGRMLSGRFSYAVKNKKKYNKIKSIAYHSELETFLLPKLPENLSLSLIVTPMEHVFKGIKYTSTTQQKNNDVCKINNNVCRTLQSYNLQKHSLIPAGQGSNIMSIFKNMWTSYIKNGCSKCFLTMPVCTISLHIREENMGTKKIVMNIGNLKLNSIFENYANDKEHRSTKSWNQIEYLPTQLRTPACGESKSDKKTNQNNYSNHKVKRKGFIKLYKKCKSTTNISNERSSLLLSKIITLEDFFQLLGSKSLCCVFDGNSSKKILSYIITMKNWVTEISSRQALLVLLLANKKDTPNLIRFRAVLLQGIAVNRITRASELDMEIEVIERENLNVVSQFEGIFYVPASSENKDNLLEELNWIAKTTASDYQKPFDESSEKLLKSLLEKRKKLNPSYLRVMARYVGLGLLKSPSKK